MGVAAADPPAASSSPTIRRRTTTSTTSPSSSDHRRPSSGSIRRVCIYLSALAPFLVYQFYVLSALTNGDHNGGCTERIANKLGTMIDSVFQSAPTSATASSTENNNHKEDRPLPFSFSACLLIKDNNIILPEWLAYHYTVLPLRRLIKQVYVHRDEYNHMDR